MITLPEVDAAPNTDVLKSLLIISHVKCGKTSNCLKIPDSILIDIGDSSEFFGGKYINVKDICRKENRGPVTVLKDIVTTIAEKNKKLGKYAYRRIVIDELTSLEEVATAYATHLYKKTPQGAEYKGNDVTELDYGKGYGLLREAMDELLNPFRSICETLVILGHIKTSSLVKGGTSVQTNDVNLTGKLKISIPANTDANGILYRNKDNQNILSFKNKGNDVITGTRIERLRDKDIVLSEMIDGKLVTHWDQIFTN